MASFAQTRLGCTRPFKASAVAPRVASRSRTVSVRAMSDEIEIQYCQPEQVKSLMNDKGYLFWDVRTPEEHAEGAKRYMTNVPVAFMTEKGPRMNNRFAQFFMKEFPNKISRVILACDDGSDRSELAYNQLAEQGYTAIKVVEGGIMAILEVDPLGPKDVAPKWRLTGQTSGVRYAYNDGDVDDSA